VSRIATSAWTEADAAGLGELGHLGQCFAGETARQRAERIQARQVQAASAELEHLDQARLVEHGVGVGRADQARDAAGNRAASSDSSSPALVPRLAEACGEVDQPGTSTAPRASIVRAGSKSRSRRSFAPATMAILSPSMPIAPASSRPLAGSTRRAFEIRIRSLISS
jgi:hypothetical protein